MKPTAINRIVKWNQERGLDQKPFDLVQEVAFVYSEILELTGNRVPNHDQYAYDFISKIQNPELSLSQEDIADGFGDIIVFSIGALHKLGYDPEQVLNLIMDANEKKGTYINHLGKIEKTQEFVAPDLTQAKSK